MRSRSFLSWSGSFRRDPLGPFGRTAALFFDETYFQTPNAHFWDQVLDGCVQDGRFGLDVAAELRTVVRPIQCLLPDYQLLKTNPWAGAHQDLIDVAERVTREGTLREEGPQPDYALQHEIMWAGAGLIESIVVWTSLNALAPCALLADPRETQVIDELFGVGRPDEGHEHFSRVLALSVPNVNQLPWERILELRGHHYLSAFKARVRDLERMLQSDDRTNLAELVRDIELGDLQELARTVRPQIGKSLMLGFLSNMLLPIPLNPISVASSVKQIHDDFVRSRRFGWLYFVLDARLSAG